MSRFEEYLEAVKKGSRKGQFKDTIKGLIGSKGAKLPKGVSSTDLFNSAERQVNKLKELNVPGAFGITMKRVKKNLGLK
jgi:hypothetical protein